MTATAKPAPVETLIRARADRLQHANGCRKARFIAVHKILSRKEQANGQ